MMMYLNKGRSLVWHKKVEGIPGINDQFASFNMGGSKKQSDFLENLN